MSQPSQDNREVKVPMHLLEALLPAIRAQGLEVPAAAQLVPKINLGLPQRELSMQLGQLLKRCGLYRKGSMRELVAQFGSEGWKEMTPHRFVGWAEKFVTFYKAYKGRGDSYYDGETSMGKDLAAKILETDEFLSELPIIERTVSVRLPVRRSDGRVEMLKPGYDEELKIWCDDEVSYPMDWTLDQAFDLVGAWCREFSWADLDAKTGNMWANRNFLVHLASMVGAFCHQLLPPGTVRPGILYDANDQGSGKLLLAAMALAGPFGVPFAAKLPLQNGFINADKFEALLDTVARSMEPYLFLDDVPPSIASFSLNQFMTNPGHTGRIYGDNQKMFKVPAVTQVFMTGNNVSVTRDLEQRTLVCELFLTKDSDAVQHTFEMTAIWLAQSDQRSKLLAAMWAFVRNWVEKGMPGSPTIKKRAPEWSTLVGGVLAAAECEGNPFEKPDMPFSGDKKTDEIRQLITALGDDAEESWVEWQNYQTDHEKPEWTGKEFDTSDIVEMARELGVLVEIVGSKDGKPLDKKDLQRLGGRLTKWRGKEDFRTSTGKAFMFGRRRQSKQTIYPITWL